MNGALGWENSEEILVLDFVLHFHPVVPDIDPVVLDLDPVVFDLDSVVLDLDFVVLALPPDGFDLPSLPGFHFDPLRHLLVPR